MDKAFSALEANMHQLVAWVSAKSAHQVATVMIQTVLQSLRTVLHPITAQQARKLQSLAQMAPTLKSIRVVWSLWISARPAQPATIAKTVSTIVRSLVMQDSSA